jgi:DNA mismatch endonuclease (patch repair protein)
LRREADIVFLRAKVAVFVDGCFWHGCPIHGSAPKRNDAFWRDKILGNQVRDAETDSALAASGWKVVRVWEHETGAEAADRVEAVVRDRSSHHVGP